MKPKISLNKDTGVVMAKTKGSFTMVEFEQAINELKSLFTGMNDRLILADVSDNERIMPKKEERDRMKELSKGLDWDKAAVVGADAIIRMSAKIVLAALGQSKKTRFFKTSEEALNWLKGEQW